MNKNNQPAKAMEESIEPDVERCIYIGTDNRRRAIATIAAYLPEGVPPETKHFVDVEIGKILSEILEDLTAIWR